MLLDHSEFNVGIIFKNSEKSIATFNLLKITCQRFTHECLSIFI